MVTYSVLSPFLRLRCLVQIERQGWSSQTWNFIYGFGPVYSIGSLATLYEFHLTVRHHIRGMESMLCIALNFRTDSKSHWKRYLWISSDFSEPSLEGRTVHCDENQLQSYLRHIVKSEGTIISRWGPYQVQKERVCWDWYKSGYGDQRVLLFRWHRNFYAVCTEERWEGNRLLTEKFN